jgi:hypothetical protein
MQYSLQLLKESLNKPQINKSKTAMIRCSFLLLWLSHQAKGDNKLIFVHQISKLVSHLRFTDVAADGCIES